MAIPGAHNAEFIEMIILAILVAGFAAMAAAIDQRDQRLSRAIRVNLAMNSVTLIPLSGAIAFYAYYTLYLPDAYANLFTVIVPAFSVSGILLFTLILNYKKRKLLAVSPREA